MKLSRTPLLNELRETTELIIDEVYELAQQPLILLNQKKESDSWSALECIDHLVQYGDYYIKVIRESMDKATASSSESYQPGWLGDYFAKSMLPGPKMKMMNSPKDKIPRTSKLDDSILQRFIDQQKQLLVEIERANDYDLGKVKCTITLSKWIKLKLGDTLRFNVYHNLRHLKQAQRAIN